MSDEKSPAPEEEKKPTFKDEVLTELKAFTRGFFKGLAASPKLVRDTTVESVQGLKSPDQETRTWSKLFIVSLFCALITIGLAGRYHYQKKQIQKQAAIEAARLEVERLAALEEERLKNRPPVYQSMGPFSLELREKAGAVRSRNSMNTVELEVVVACQDPEICEWIKDHMDIARGELSPLFVPADRDKLLSIPGKKGFREEIRDQLNRLLERKGMKGEIVDILFPRFIMS